MFIKGFRGIIGSEGGKDHDYVTTRQISAFRATGALRTSRIALL